MIFGKYCRPADKKDGPTKDKLAWTSCLTAVSVMKYCEILFLAIREEYRLKVFENLILRRIFGPKRDANGKWRKLHNEKPHRFLLFP